MGQETDKGPAPTKQIVSFKSDYPLNELHDGRSGLRLNDGTILNLT